VAGSILSFLGECVVGSQLSGELLEPHHKQILTWWVTHYLKFTDLS
jgi:hypothetical protein